jgi:hypothetical protein
MYGFGISRPLSASDANVPRLKSLTCTTHWLNAAPAVSDSCEVKDYQGNVSSASKRPLAAISTKWIHDILAK